MGRIHMYFGTDFWLTSRTSCSVTGLKVSKGLSKKKEVSTWAGATVWGKQFLNVRILSMKNSERKNVRESNQVKAGGKKRTFDLSKNISEVAKQFFRWLASLDLARAKGRMTLSTSSVTLRFAFSYISLWMVSLDLCQRRSFLRRSRFNTRNWSAMLLYQGVGFLC